MNVWRGDSTNICSANKIFMEVVMLICIGTVLVGYWPIVSTGLMRDRYITLRFGKSRRSASDM